MAKDNLSQSINCGVGGASHSPTKSEDSGAHSRYSLDKETGSATCRVCQCTESDKRGDAVLGFLGIISPLQESCKSSGAIKLQSEEVSIHCETNDFHSKNAGREFGLIQMVDFKKVLVSLKDYEALRERTTTGDPNPTQVHASLGVDPDAVAAIRRQRLSEISMWFSPLGNSDHNNSNAVSQVVSEQPLNAVTEDIVPPENLATKWAVEGTGILLATGLLTVTLAWLIAPHVGKGYLNHFVHDLNVECCSVISLEGSGWLDRPFG
ncbi:hypothetical protein GH714_008120 [Hevea brasiliensis]|uniref:Uncharacterized protein n=1 Tax=Hevea brasiliensis TaxID=3981 RepID=A0A6A6K487_HEVBR|nr:hypothetical protein GH714_008120 [Hevea brasiliensis]